MNLDMDYFKQYLGKGGKIKYEGGGKVQLDADLAAGRITKTEYDQALLKIQNMNSSLSELDSDLQFPEDSESIGVTGQGNNSSTYDSYFNPSTTLGQQDLLDQSLLPDNPLDPNKKAIVTEEEYNNSLSNLPNNNSNTTSQSPLVDDEGNFIDTQQKGNDINQLLGGASKGMSLENALFNLGQSASYDGNRTGANAARGVGAIGKLAIGGARNFLSGYSFQKRNQQVNEDYLKRLKTDARNNIEYQEDGGVVGEDDLYKPFTYANQQIEIIPRDFNLQNIGIGNYDEELEQPESNYESLEVLKKGGYVKENVYKDGGVVYRGENFSGYNKPKRTSSHPTKSHAVLAKDGDNIKLIRFGQQGVEGAGSNPTSEKEKARRKSFKARHASNIKKGKMSAAYWASKTKWEDGGELMEEQEMGRSPKENELSIEEMLAGEKVSEKVSGPVNAELENGEYLMYPTGDIQEVVGKDHEQGGVDLQLPEGTRILSNNLEIGKEVSKRLKEEHDLKLKPSDTYAEAVSKFSDKVGITKLNKDQEFLIKKLKDLKEDSPSYKTNSEYIKSKLSKIEEDKQELNNQRAGVFSMLFDKQESTKPQTTQKEGSFFEDGGIKEKIESGEYTIKENRVIDTRTGVEVGSLPEGFGNSLDDNYSISFGKNAYEDDGFFGREKQSLSKDGKGFGRVTSDNIESIMKAAYRNFPDIAEEVFSAKFDEEGNFTFDKTIDFSKENDKVLQYQKKVDSRMRAEANTVINNPEFYGKDAVTSAKDYLTNQTFDETLARKNDKLMGNFTSSRFSLKTSVVTPEELEKLRSKNIFTLKQLSRAIDNGEVDFLSDTSKDRFSKVSNTLEENADFGLKTYTQGESEPAVTQNLDSEVTDGTGDLIAKRRDKGDFFYIAPDQSLLPPSATEPHLKVKNRFQRIDPVKIGIEQNLQEAFRQQQFIDSQVSSSNPNIKAAFLANSAANTQRTVNNAITQTNIVNAQNQQRAEQFNIGQSDRENIAEGNNALNYERRQLTAKAKTDKDLRDYFAFNREVQLNNILREQQLSAIDAMSEDYSIDPFGNTFFDPTYEFRPTSSNAVNNELSIDEQRKLVDLELKKRRLARQQGLAE